MFPGNEWGKPGRNGGEKLVPRLALALGFFAMAFTPSAFFVLAN
jgi:hypothetical protein